MIFQYIRLQQIQLVIQPSLYSKHPVRSISNKFVNSRPLQCFHMEQLVFASCQNESVIALVFLYYIEPCTRHSYNRDNFLLFFLLYNVTILDEI